MRTLCLGEALVDMVCERHVDRLEDADAFVPHFGGAVSNVAVTAARRGAGAALAGGAGDDAWGRWLRARLEEAGVDLTWFRLDHGAPTPVAFVAVDAQGEPDYLIYGAGISAAVRHVAADLDDAVEACDALFFSSNTLAEPDERAITERAHQRALALSRPVLVDPNLRLHRWPSPEDAVAATRPLLEDALLVRCNRAEAELLTGERDPDRAARALLGTGARVVVVTLGADGAIARGAVQAHAPGVPADVISTMGAGDAFMGVLVAELGNADFDPAAIPAALPAAVAESSRATERWGALA